MPKKNGWQSDLHGKINLNLKDPDPFLTQTLAAHMVKKSSHFTMQRENPAYGRHQISRPMRIVAPMPQQGGPRIHKNQKELKNRRKKSKTEKLKNVQRYTFQPEISDPSGSVVSTMFCKAKSKEEKNFFLRSDFRPHPNKMLNSETTSFQHFSPRVRILNLYKF